MTMPDERDRIIMENAVKLERNNVLFEELGSRFAAFEESLHALRTEMRSGFQTVATQLMSVETRLTSVEVRLTRVEKHLESNGSPSPARKRKR